MPTTFLDKLKTQLAENGMFPHQVETVIEAFLAGENESTTYRVLGEDPEGYDPGVYNVIWCILCTYALKYIDKECPSAWFRPCFLTPSEQEAFLKTWG